LARKLTFGYLYDFRNPPQWRRPTEELYADILDFIAWTETAGFDAAWLPEHHGADDDYIPSPLIALAAIAARTKTLKIGTAIALAPLYHPLRFAEDCAVLDILCRGRLELALAIGYRRKETAAFGVDFSTRGRRFDAFLDAVRRLWAGETVSVRNAFFDLENATVTPRPTRRIPLYIGGFADKALDRVAKYGDGYFGNAEVCDLLAEKLRAAGKNPAEARIRLLDLFLAVAHDPDAAWEELAPYFLYVNNAYSVWQVEAGTSELRAMTLDEFRASRMLKILTPGQAIDKFRALQASTGLEHFMLMAPAGANLGMFRKYADVFAREVIPAFA
jgi:alkanesulfonate monooxygenase SsuD/methylene tetrahydromethanopterin reductase-like flavin-dependent oxidoreductase (luciferase family)